MNITSRIRTDLLFSFKFAWRLPFSVSGEATEIYG